MTKPTQQITGTISKIIDSPAEVTIMSTDQHHIFILKAADITRLALTIGSLTVEEHVTLTVSNPFRMFGSVTAITLG